MRDVMGSMGFRLSLMFGALFVLYGVQLPYLPVWLDHRGLGAVEISLLTAIPLFLRLVATPWFGVVADSTANHRGVAIALAWAAVVSSVLLGVTSAGWLLTLTLFVLMVSAPSIMPLCDTIAMRAARHGDIDYGNVRIWGSVLFIIANVGAGFVVEELGGGAVIWLMAGGALIAALSFYMLPKTVAGTVSGQAAARRRAGLGEALELFRIPGFGLFIFAAGLIQASHAVFYLYGILHWRSLGISAGVVGALWAIGVIAEILLFRLSRQLLAVLGAAGLIVLGGAGGMVRWSAMALDPPMVWLVVLQTMHALTFAATHVGAMHFLLDLLPEAQAGAAQAVLSTFTSSIAMGAAMLLSGLLYAEFGGGSYLAMAVFSGIGAGLAWWLPRRGSRSSLS